MPNESLTFEKRSVIVNQYFSRIYNNLFSKIFDKKIQNKTLHLHRIVNHQLHSLNMSQCYCVLISTDILREMYRVNGIVSVIIYFNYFNYYKSRHFKIKKNKYLNLKSKYLGKVGIYNTCSNS